MDKANCGKRILVVEDEASVSHLCRIVLNAEGFVVDIAPDGEVAKGMLCEQDYDLLLIDIKTPVTNGQQLYQHIRERHPELDSRIVFTTGDMIATQNRLFLERSGRPLLAKPFTPTELRGIVTHGFIQAGALNGEKAL